MLLSNGQELEILPSITTAFIVGKPKVDWPGAILSLKRLDLRRCALFLTGLEKSERQTCYRLLLAARQEFEFTLPFVHARYDMAPEEFTFLRVEFGADRFNLHPIRQFPLSHALPREIRDRTYIENAKFLQQEDLWSFAGVCLDLSHLEDLRRYDPLDYVQLLRLIKLNPPGCSHLSAVPPRTYRYPRPRSSHFMNKVEDYAYLSNYRPEQFGRYAAIELLNPLDDQLEAIRYIRSLFKL